MISLERRKPRRSGAFLSKRLMGFEPTTFCMAIRPGFEDSH